MISYLQGKVILKKEKFIILEVQDIGYQVFLSKTTLDKIGQTGETCKVFCYLDVGERSLRLYGFLTYGELELFGLLRNISGVGPKAALDISSIGSPEKIREEIEKGNEKIFENIPGIGGKKARKIILELSGKLKAPAPTSQKEILSKDEAFLALINLGFSQNQIREALLKIPKEIKDTETKIKKALEILGKKR